MRKIQQYGFYFLLIGVTADFLTPYVLGIFYPELNQMKEVMSIFGEVGSPVRTAFLIWSVVAGSFYVLSLPAIYQVTQSISKKLAESLVLALGAYGIGDCIFTGLFSVDTQEAQWNFSTWVHNVGSGVGYAGFFLFPFILYLVYKKQKAKKESDLYLSLFILNLIVALLYGLARIPGINEISLFSVLGFWQRLSFFFNYVPIVWFAIVNLRQKKLAQK